MTTLTPTPGPGPEELTPEQRAIVEADDGPVVVIAGAGTGKTRVIVERVRWLLENKGAPGLGTGGLVPAEPTPRHGNPFEGPLVPEQLLVLTYNVKAAKELQERLDRAVGPATRARMTVSNFHSFCQHVLTESAGDAGLPARPDVLDGVGQLLLLRDLRPTLDLRYHTDYAFPDFVGFISRAKDELVDPDDYDRFVAEECRVYEVRYGSFEEAGLRLEAQGNLEPLRKVRGAYANLRANERAEDAGELREYDARMFVKATDREARRSIAGDGHAHGRNHFGDDDHARIDRLADEYERDGAALEILRLTEIARVYRAYEEALAARGALDFGEQIALVTRLFKTRPNVLRRWQRQFRYILVDEFQDANVAQIELIELLGRTPDRPANVMVVGDDDQSIYRFRGASYAAFAEFDIRFKGPRRLRIDQNFRSVGHVIEAANRLIGRNETRFEPDKRLWTDKAAGVPVELHRCAGAEDEAVAIVDAIRALAGPPADALLGGPGRPSTVGVEVVPGKRNQSPGPEPGGASSGAAGADDSIPTAAPARTDHALVVPLGWNDLEGDVGHQGAPPSAASPARRRYNDVAVLYRKHKHRDAIVARLRDEDIPYTVVGGLSLFEAPEIRDLEQGLRAIADPHDSAALVRMMTAGPWRLDALEILRVTRAHDFDRGTPLVEIAGGPTGRGRHRPGAAGQAARPPGCHRGAQPAHLARGPVHHPGALPGADRRGPGPPRGRHPGSQAIRRQHRELHALRVRLAGREPGQDPRGLHRLPRRLQGRRRRAADQRGAVRGRRRRPPHDPLPGEGPGVPHRHRPQPARRGVARPRAELRPVPARAPARAGPRGRPPHGRGAAAPVRRDDPRPGAAPAHDPGRWRGEGREPVRGGDRGRGGGGAGPRGPHGGRRGGDRYRCR